MLGVEEDIASFLGRTRLQVSRVDTRANVQEARRPSAGLECVLLCVCVWCAVCGESVARKEGRGT